MLHVKIHFAICKSFEFILKINVFQAFFTQQTGLIAYHAEQFFIFGLIKKMK